MWFAALSAQGNRSVGRDGWIVHLIWKLLHNDEVVLQLIEENPFVDQPPTKIRVQLYRYHFSSEQDWWERAFVRTWIDPVDKNTMALRQYLQQRKWN